jgi:hypothetical protein
MPNTNIVRNTGKRIDQNQFEAYDMPMMSIQDQLRNQTFDQNHLRYPKRRNGDPEDRSVSRFNLDENRAHNPHENATASAKMHIYEASPQKRDIKHNKRCFLQKINDREYQGVLKNKNEARGFDRYVADCKLHLVTALQLKQKQMFSNIQSPIPIIIPQNHKSS